MVPLAPVKRIRSRQVTLKGAATLDTRLQTDQRSLVKPLLGGQDWQKINAKTKTNDQPGGKFRCPEKHNMAPCEI